MALSESLKTSVGFVTICESRNSEKVKNKHWGHLPDGLIFYSSIIYLPNTQHLLFSPLSTAHQRGWGFIMEMKPSLSTFGNQMQDLDSEHHHHHQSNLTLTRPGYEKQSLQTNSSNKDGLLMSRWSNPRVEVRVRAAAHALHVCAKAGFFITRQYLWQMPNSRGAERREICEL